LQKYIGKTVEVSGVVTEDAEYKNDDYRVRLKTNYGLVYIMLGKQIDLSRSDMLTVAGKAQSGFGDFVAFFYHPEVKNIAHPQTPD
jgi:hypothetical protein